METIAILGIFAVGFAMGLYISTQISDWIDKNTKR
tara:strand:+ start:165 stop:269 length:105 start_codon:yes stop_codon:yes gene_type:complete